MTEKAENHEVPNKTRLLRATIMLHHGSMSRDEAHEKIDEEQNTVDDGSGPRRLTPEDTDYLRCLGCPHVPFGSACCGCGGHILAREQTVSDEEFQALLTWEAKTVNLEVEAGHAEEDSRAATAKLKAAFAAGADEATTDGLMSEAVEMGARAKYAREKATAARIATSGWKKVT